MKTVKIDAKELLSCLLANRKKHIEEHTEADAGFRQSIINGLKAALKVANAGGNIESEVLRVLWSTAPVSYIKDYDRAITMLQMTVEPIIELSVQEFDQLVMDEWSWKKSFEISASLYKSK